MQHHLILQTIKQIIATIEAGGGKVPKRTADAFTAFTELIAKVEALDVTSKAPAAILDALEADRDPGTDPTVQAAFTRRDLAGFTYGLGQELDSRATALAEEHAVALLEALRSPFDKAAATLVTAYERLGDVDLDDTAAVLSKGGDAARCWADAQDAERVIGQVEHGWSHLALATRSASRSTRYRLLSIADVPASTWLDDNLDSSSMSGWQVVRRGWSLSLASPATLAERIEAVLAEQQSRAAHAVGAFERDYQRTHGAGRPVATG